MVEGKEEALSQRRDLGKESHFSLHYGLVQLGIGGARSITTQTRSFLPPAIPASHEGVSSSPGYSASEPAPC